MNYIPRLIENQIKEKLDFYGAISVEGCIVRLKMRPMSLFESGDSTTEISVNELFSAPRKILGHDSKTLQDIIDLAIRGGWPEAVVKTPKNPNMIVIDYIDSIINDQENYTIANSYSSYKMRDVIRSMARNICTPINNSAIAKDSKVSNETVASYTTLLKSLHILDDIPAWSPKLRSKTEIRSGNKRNFVDPSLAIAAESAAMSLKKLASNIDQDDMATPLCFNYKKQKQKYSHK